MSSRLPTPPDRRLERFSRMTIVDGPMADALQRVKNDPQRAPLVRLAASVALRELIREEQDAQRPGA